MQWIGSKSFKFQKAQLSTIKVSWKYYCLRIKTIKGNGKSLQWYKNLCVCPSGCLNHDFSVIAWLSLKGGNQRVSLYCVLKLRSQRGSVNHNSLEKPQAYLNDFILYICCISLVHPSYKRSCFCDSVYFFGFVLLLYCCFLPNFVNWEWLWWQREWFTMLIS